MTNISKVTLNPANERPLPLWCAVDLLLGQEVGENVQWSMKAWSWKTRRGDLPTNRMTRQSEAVLHEVLPYTTIQLIYMTTKNQYKTSFDDTYGM